MSRKLPFYLLTLCALSFAPAAFPQNVFVMPPANGSVSPVLPFRADPFTPAGSLIAAQDTFQAFALPNGSKYFFVGRSGTNTVVITDASFNQVASPLAIGTGATAAALTPDGRYLVVLAGSVQIVNTSSNTVVATLDGGASPNDVAISRDGTRAFVVSQASGRLTAFDLNSFGVLGTLQNLGPVNGVAVGPNGLVYVAATNIMYELDPRDLSFRNGSGIPLNAQPGKPSFLADDFGNVRVIAANMNPGFGGSSMITIDLGTRVATPLLANGIILDKLIPVSGSRLFATSQNGQLYDITAPSILNAAAFNGLTSTSGVRSAVTSNEAPNARYLYLTYSSNNTIARVDLQNNTASGTFPLSAAPGPVSFAGATTTGLPNRLITYNNQQFVNPSAQTLPLIVRAVDATGKPLSGVPVQFTTAASGAFIVNSSASTDGEGFAQAVAIAPSVFGTFTVTATAGSGVVVTANFNLTVGTGTTGPTGAIQVRGGNGQVIRETNITPELLRVIVRDTNGNPVPNAVVNWGVTTLNGPNGSLSATQTVTDFLGESSNTYIAPFLGPNLLSSYVQSTITASTVLGSVNMYVTVIPNLFGNNPASNPSVQLIQPQNTETITAQAGTTLLGAVQVRVTAGSGPGSGTVIPNVAINASTGLDPTIAPSAVCSATSALTDSNGVGTCDLVIGSRTGTTPFTITVGGSTVATLNLVVTPGVPGKMILLQGDAQNGNPGQTLPLALLARIEDNFGNPLPNVNVTWTVESGSATLVNTINRSDNQARVSTLVRLGAGAGQVRIRVTAQGGSAAATLVFTANTNISATQIRKISGDSQTAIVNQAFGEQLVAQVLDANGQGVSGLAVTFQVRSGSASVGTATATSDSGGNVRTSVTAGSQAGPVTIAADFGGNTVTWSLTVLPIGPTLTASGITNAATGQQAIAPGSIATIRGTNIASTVSGYVLPQNDFGPRPTSLAGVSVSFGGVQAPIFWVSNVGGQEAVAVQVPFEAPENSTVPVTVTSNGTSATVNIQIAAYAPGIFENVDAQGRRYAVATRADGSFITPDNPADRGEAVRLFVTGLGRTSTPATTNGYGAPNQRVTANVIVGVNDGGVQITSAEYAENLIGVYVVTFTVPADTATGASRNLAVAVDAGGNVIFSNGSSIAIR